MFSALKKFLGGAEKKEILAPVSGKVIPMSQVADPTFSQEILGTNPDAASVASDTISP